MTDDTTDAKPGWHYTSAARESAPYSLPNIEVFWADAGEWWYDQNGERVDEPVCEACDVSEDAAEGHCEEHFHWGGCDSGWYYWFCLPGCLPDSEPTGPFASVADALENAREMSGEDDE